jgi:hypothetical protein
VDLLQTSLCGNTDSNFFALDPKIVPKLGNLRFGNSKTGENGLVKSLVIRTGVKPEGNKYLPGLDTKVSYGTV